MEEREHYSRALMDLLAAVVFSSRSGRPVTPSGLEALLEQLTADIFSRLDDPDLGPADLAGRHSISLRYVHRLFGAEPPAAFIRRHRLLAASDLVARTTPYPLPMASIAIRCGFRDRIRDNGRRRIRPKSSVKSRPSTAPWSLLSQQQ